MKTVGIHLKLKVKKVHLAYVLINIKYFEITFLNLIYYFFDPRYLKVWKIFFERFFLVFLFIFISFHKPTNCNWEENTG